MTYIRIFGWHCTSGVLKYIFLSCARYNTENVPCKKNSGKLIFEDKIYPFFQTIQIVFCVHCCIVRIKQFIRNTHILVLTGIPTIQDIIFYLLIGHFIRSLNHPNSDTNQTSSYIANRRLKRNYPSDIRT